MSYATGRKRNTMYWQLFFIIVLSCCCLYEIWTMASLTSSGQIWLDEIFHFLYDYPFISKIATSVLLLLNVVFLLLFFRRLLLVEHRSYAPILLYLLFIFIFPQMMNVWSMLTGFFIITGIFPQLFGIDEDNIHVKTFAYGLCCGILAVMDVYFVSFLFFIYFCCLLNRIYTFRSFLLPIVGFSIAFIYLFSIFYLTDSYEMMHRFIDLTKEKFTFSSANENPIENSFYSWMRILITGVISLFSFFKLLTKASNVVIHKRKKYYVLLLLICSFSVLLLVFRSSAFLFMQGLLMLCVMIICMAMSHGKRNLFYKLLFLVLFVFGFAHVFFL